MITRQYVCPLRVYKRSVSRRGYHSSMCDLLKFKHPFTCIVAGPTGSVKTSLCIKLLRNLDTQYTESRFGGGIIRCNSEETAVPRQQLDKVGLNIIYQEGLPEKYGNALGEPSLIILDDLLNQVYSKDVCDLFTKGSHHRNISLLLLTQNLFHQGTNYRDILLNAKYLVLLKNIRYKNQFLYLARQAYPEDSHSLYDAYRDATRQLHGYLVLDFAQDTDDTLRFRTKSFQTKVPQSCMLL